ncbi:hypothetical protein [Streptomyces sp. NPDC001436]
MERLRRPHPTDLAGGRTAGGVLLRLERLPTVPGLGGAGGRGLSEAGDGQADACERDWNAHTVAVEASTVPLPDMVAVLLERLEEEIDKLAKTSPVTAVRAARRTVRCGWRRMRTDQDQDRGPGPAARRAPGPVPLLVPRSYGLSEFR